MAPIDSLDLVFRTARREDVRTIVSMLMADSLGKQRESSSPDLPQSYYHAFADIEADPNNSLVVVEYDDRIVGVMQITYIPYLSYQGSWRALIEGVRVHQDHRSLGIGRRMFEWAIEQARTRGCKLVQLTSDKRRTDAIRFYESLGFKATHEGFKMWF